MKRTTIGRDWLRRGFAAGVFFALFVAFSGYAQAHEFGLYSERYLYTGEHPSGSDGLRIDKDSKIQWWNYIYGVDHLADDFVDKREGKKSLRCTIAVYNWFTLVFMYDGNDDDTADPIDMRAYANGSIKFWIKTEQPLNLGIGDSSGKKRWVTLGVPIDNQWYFVSVPINKYFSAIDFSNVTYLFMLQEEFLPPLDRDRMFHIDNVRWDTEIVGSPTSVTITPALDTITVAPAAVTMPQGLPKAFAAQGYDANANTVDVYPDWTSPGINGNFSNTSGDIAIFTPTAAGSGSVTATEGSTSGSSTVNVQDLAWNDFFNLFIDEGIYGSLGTYDADDDADEDGEPDDGDDIENNSILIELVTDEHPPGAEKTLKASYSITDNGWAGVFIQEGEPLVINPDMEIGNVAPVGWTTYTNELTNETGWVTDDSHSGNHSLKIIRTTAANAGWHGQTVTFTGTYPTTISFGGWSKAENVVLGAGSPGGLYALDFKIVYDDDLYVYYCPEELWFSPGTHGWEYRSVTHTFAKPVKSITPYCILYNGSTGTVWFDDVYVQAELPDSRDLSLFEDGYLYFWIKTPVDLEIGLRSANIPKTFEMSKVMLSQYDVPADNDWHEVYIALDDFKIWDQRLDFAEHKILFNAAVVGKIVSDYSNTFWISGVKYVRRKEVSPGLSVGIFRRDNDQPEPSNSVNFSEALLGGAWTLADQYLRVIYDTPYLSWGIQIYTDNLASGADPQYAGNPEGVLSERPAGLIGRTNTLVTCPMAWMALEDTSPNVPVPVEEPNEYPENHPDFMIYFRSDTNGMWGEEKARGEWSWLKDLSSATWDDKNGDFILDLTGSFGDPDYEIVSDFSATGDEYSTFIGPAGIAAGWVDKEDGTRIYVLNPKQPIAIYLAAKFRVARERQEYRTNTLTLELYHY